MAVKQIPNLTPAVFISPSAQIEIVQDGTTFRASIGQITSFSSAKITIEADSTSSLPAFPLFSKVDAGDVSTIYTSDPNYTFRPSEGRLSALRVVSSQGIFLNGTVVDKTYTLPSGDNGMSCGPITISSELTIPDGSVWAVL